MTSILPSKGFTPAGCPTKSQADLQLVKEVTSSKKSQELMSYDKYGKVRALFTVCFPSCDQSLGVYIFAHKATRPWRLWHSQTDPRELQCIDELANLLNNAASCR